MVDLGEIFGAADRRALVDADLIADGDAVGEEAGDGLRVEPLDVIAFQEGVHDQLPVRRDVVDAAAEEVMAGEAEGVEFGRERVRVGEIRSPRARTRSGRPPRRSAAPSDDGRPCRGRGSCPGAACAARRRRPCRSRHDRGRRCAGISRRSPASISRVPRCRQTFQKTWATPCLSRVSSSGMPKPSCATAILGSGSRAEGAITIGSRSNSLRLLGGEAGRIGIDRGGDGGDAVAHASARPATISRARLSWPSVGRCRVGMSMAAIVRLTGT